MRRTLSILAVLCMGLAAVGSAQAADLTWNTASSGLWTDGLKWNDGSGATPVDGDTAWLLPVAGQTADYTVSSLPTPTGGLGFNSSVQLVIGGTSGTAKQILVNDANNVWLKNVVVNPTGVYNQNPGGWWNLYLDNGSTFNNQGTFTMTPRPVALGKGGFGLNPSIATISGANPKPVFLNSGAIIISGIVDNTAGTLVARAGFYGSNVDYVNVGSGNILVQDNGTFSVGGGYVPAGIYRNGSTLTNVVKPQTNTIAGTVKVQGFNAVYDNFPDGSQDNPPVVVLSSGGMLHTPGTGNLGDTDWYARNFRTIVKAGGTLEDQGGPMYDALRSQNVVIENGGLWKNHRQAYFEGDVTNNAGGTIICGGAWNAGDSAWKGSGIRVGNDSAAGATFTNSGYWEIQNSIDLVNAQGNFGIAQSPYVGGQYHGTLINNGFLNITANSTTINFGDTNKDSFISGLNIVNNGTINRIDTAATFNLTATNFTNNGTMNWGGLIRGIPDRYYGSPLGDTNFAASNQLFTNSATGTFNASSTAVIGATGGNGHLLFDNYGTLNLAGSTFGGTPTGNGTDYGYIRQSTAAAVTKGFGQVNVDFMATGIVNLNTANFGHLQGTLKATGGTMVVSNLAGTTGVANNAQTLIVDATGKLAADNGVLAVQGMEADVQVNGTLSLRNGGLAIVSGAGMSFGSGAVAEYGLKSKAATTTLLSVDGALALAGSVSVIDEGGIQAGKYLLATAGGAITGTMTTPNLIGGKHSVLDTATAGKVYLDLFNGGDANADGKVDVLDLGILATNWQKTGMAWGQADFNGDGKIDVLDLGILATNWQATSGSFADAAAQAGLIVPEPATLALLGLGAAALIRRRKNA